MDMSVILTQMGVLVLMMLAGFACAKLKVTGPAFNKSVSSVTMNVLLVSSILGSAMTSNVSLSALELLGYIGVGFVMFAVSLLVGMLTPKILGIKGDDAGLTFFMVMLMNTVFVGFPVVEVLYGADGIFYASLSNIPFNILTYSVGLAGVRGGGKPDLKRILCAPLVATLIALVIVATGLRVPRVIAETCTTMGRATVPVSMLMIGTSLGAVSIGRALGNWKVYIICFIRLIVCPLLTWLVLRLFVTDPVILGTYTILASAPVAMVATVLAIQYDKNETFSSQTVFISTALSAATMPFMIWLLL